MHLITGIFGQSFWAVTLGELIPSSVMVFLPGEVLPYVVGLKLGGLVAYVNIFMLLSLSGYMFVSTAISTRQLIRPIKQWFTIGVIIGAEVFWFGLDFYRDYQGLVLMNFGLLSSLIACKLIISSVTKVPLFSHR